MIKIESGVPAPTGRSGYPFASMDVGDSFLIEAADGDAAKKASTSIGASARNFSKGKATKFTVRRVEGGVRCWRTE